MPGGPLALLIGSLLLQSQNRRLGRKWWQGMNPLDPPFKDFNRREWIILGILAIAAMALAVAAVNYGR